MANAGLATASFDRATRSHCWVERNMTTAEYDDVSEYELTDYTLCVRWRERAGARRQAASRHWVPALPCDLTHLSGFFFKQLCESIICLVHTPFWASALPLCVCVFV